MTSRISNARRPARLLAALLLAFFALATPLYSGTTQAQSTTRPANPYSVNLFLHKEVEPWKIEQTLRLVSEANIPWVKQEFPWQEIEFKKGYFYDDKWGKSAWEKYDYMVDMASKYHLDVIARVDHAPEWARSTAGKSPLNDNKDLADFINALLDHYKGRIKYVQVWNEPNLAGEWVPGKVVDPAGYADMLKTVYSAVKPGHPDAVLLSAPMATTLEHPNLQGNMNEIDYWNGLYSVGVKGNFDIASANAYGLDHPPDAAPDPKVLNFRRVELLRDIMVKNGDTAKPIWFDEYGWNASPETLTEAEKNYWRHVTPQQQAQWTVDGIEYARKNWPWAGVISIWYFRQVGDIPPEKAEYYFAMVNPDFSTQPVYDAVKADALKFAGPIAQPEPTVANPKPTARSVAPATQTPPPPTAVPSATPQPAPPTATNQQEATATATATATVPALPTSPPTQAATPSASATIAAPTVTSIPSATIASTPVATSTSIIAGAGTGAGSNTPLYVLGGLLILAGLAGIGFYFMRAKAS